MNDELGAVQPAHPEGAATGATASKNTQILPGPKRHPTLPPVESKAERKVSSKDDDKLILDMLRRLNMAFDLFEIQAKFEFLEDGNRVHITVRNTATGKVIRRIPPTELQTNFNNLREGMGLIVNQSI